MIYVTGDTHGGAAGDLKKLNSRNFPQGKTLTKNDYVIVAGDFGCVWSNPSSEGYKSDLHVQKWLHEKPWTTLFVDGNHENHDMLDELETVEMFGADVGKVNESIYHLRRGRVYEIGGNKIFVMGGALSIDKENRTLGISYWEQEVPSYADMDFGLETLEKHNWEVDYVITHTCPEYVVQRFISEHNAGGLYGNKVNDPTANYLEYIRESLSFKRWYYGHWHEDWEYDKFTLLYQKVTKLGKI